MYIFRFILKSLYSVVVQKYANFPVHFKNIDSVVVQKKIIIIKQTSLYYLFFKDWYLGDALNPLHTVSSEYQVIIEHLQVTIVIKHLYCSIENDVENEEW